MHHIYLLSVKIDALGNQGASLLKLVLLSSLVAAVEHFHNHFFLGVVVDPFGGIQTDDLFLSGKPLYYLGEFVSLIRGPPSMFGKVDVESFKHLSVVIICSPK